MFYSSHRLRIHFRFTCHSNTLTSSLCFQVFCGTCPPWTAWSPSCLRVPCRSWWTAPSCRTRPTPTVTARTPRSSSTPPRVWGEPKTQPGTRPARGTRFLFFALPSRRRVNFGRTLSICSQSAVCLQRVWLLLCYFQAHISVEQRKQL